MVDVLLVLIVLGFFAVSVAYVRGCDRLIAKDGADDDARSERSGR